MLGRSTLCRPRPRLTTRITLAGDAAAIAEPVASPIRCDRDLEAGYRWTAVMADDALVPAVIHLAVALAAAFAGGLAASLLRLPTQLGYLVAGLLVGTLLAAPAARPATLGVAADLAVAGLLFILAQQVSLRPLLERPAVAVAVSVQFLGIALAGAWLATELGVDPRAGFVIGAALAPSSTVFAAEVLADRGAKATRTIVAARSLGQGAIALAVVALGFAPGVGNASLGPFGPGGLTTALALLLLPLAVVAGLALLRWVLARLGDPDDEIAQLSVIGIVLLAVAVPAVQVGLPLAVVALVAGWLVAADERARTTLRRVTVLREVFVALFLVGLGSLLDPGVLVREAGVVIAITGVVVALKFITAAAIARGARLSLSQATLAGAALAPLGEIAFVVGQEGLERGVLDAEEHQVILGAAATSVAAVSVAIPAVARPLPRAAAARRMA
jgi:Kef-type K+ transport system membrane component KefB